jgi:quinol monooxygenase YgiN/uncharacterized protein YunC (DUF1805 family)
MNTAIATLRARPGATSTLESLLRALQIETAAEPGTLAYDVLRGDDGTLVVYERYASPEAKAAHFASLHLAKALAQAGPLLAAAPAIQHLASVGCLGREAASVDGLDLEVVTLPIGPVNLVYARAPHGVLGCGAIDPAPLGRFGIAAARVRPTTGAFIRNLDELLAGEVRDANDLAAAKGVRCGLSGREALRLLSGRASAEPVRVA